MRHVGDGQQGGVQFSCDLFLLLFQDAGLFAQRLALGDQLLLAGRVLLLGDELGDLVLPLLNALRFSCEAPAFVVELHDAIHVGLDVAVDGSSL